MRCQSGLFSGKIHSTFDHIISLNEVEQDVKKIRPLKSRKKGGRMDRRKKGNAHHILTPLGGGTTGEEEEAEAD